MPREIPAGQFHWDHFSLTNSDEFLKVEIDGKVKSFKFKARKS